MFHEMHLLFFLQVARDRDVGRHGLVFAAGFIKYRVALAAAGQAHALGPVTGGARLKGSCAGVAGAALAV